MNSEQPYFFLVGAERSGTTMLRLMLDSHPKLAWQNEFEFSVDRVSAKGQWPELSSYYDWLTVHRIFRATGFQVDKQLDYLSLVESFLDQKRRKKNVALVGATVHRHFDRLLELWPDARFIHFVRDGRDVALSNIGMGWAGNVYTGAARWQQSELLWSSLKSRLSADQYIEISYESLVDNPQHDLERLCDFIGVEYSPEMLAYDKHTTYSIPDKKHIQSWKKKLTVKQVQLIESRISGLLLDRGYALSDYPSIEPDGAERCILRLHDRFSRIRFRLSRYGVILFTQDYLSRLLGLSDWQKSVRLRLNSIDQSRLK